MKRYGRCLLLSLLFGSLLCSLFRPCFLKWGLALINCTTRVQFPCTQQEYSELDSQYYWIRNYTICSTQSSITRDKLPFLQFCIALFGPENTKRWVLCMTNLCGSRYKILHIHIEVEQYLFCLLFCLLYRSLFRFLSCFLFCFLSSVLLCFLLCFLFRSLFCFLCSLLFYVQFCLLFWPLLCSLFYSLFCFLIFSLLWYGFYF